MNPGEPPANFAGSPFENTNLQTPPRGNGNNNAMNQAPLLRRTNAIRNDPPQLPQPLRLFDDEVATEIADDEDFDAFFNENGEIRVAQPARPSNQTTTNSTGQSSSGFGSKFCSLKKFIKKYMKFGHSRQRAIAKYHKAKLHFGSEN